jgi:hypothetical protein
VGCVKSYFREVLELCTRTTWHHFASLEVELIVTNVTVLGVSIPGPRLSNCYVPVSEVEDFAVMGFAVVAVTTKYVIGFRLYLQ